MMRFDKGLVFADFEARAVHQTGGRKVKLGLEDRVVRGSCLRFQGIGYKTRPRLCKGLISTSSRADSIYLCRKIGMRVMCRGCG